MAFEQNPYSAAALDCRRCATTGLIDGELCSVCSGLGKIAAVSKRRFMGMDSLPPEPKPVQSEDDKILASLFTPDAPLQASPSGRVTGAPGSVGMPSREELETFIHASTWSDFLTSLSYQLRGRNSLSERQWQAARSIFVEQLNRGNRRGRSTSPQAFLPRLRALFTTAMRGGAERVTFRTVPMLLTATPSRTSAPAIIFARGPANTSLGKIVGEVYFSRSVNQQADEVTLTTLTRINEDPGAFAMAYGRDTNTCACCGEPLVEPNARVTCIHVHCARDWGI